ncbi:DnaJ domain protein [Ancylostoma duodenale]|uniref:DnaJ domain protein n=1 Tax=Ancylostoma duodenale TaxID=51022 RepID=A0A0C2CYF4_9BILA|nr:DnaJ domain protein [Ancylostoma duodenale]
MDGMYHICPGGKLNYYDILGVKSDATADEIRAAFVRKSHELHPDRSSKPQEKRRAWRRSSDTELFMQVKEAYDCLRKPEKRAAYDDQLVTSAGYLKEATHLKYQEDTIVDLNRARNDNYTGPRGRNSEPSHHFRDLEEEYYREKHKNRMLVVLAGLIGCLILANISYVWKDYYQVLGVQRDATQRQIKVAYYQLSKKYHPDVAGHNAGSEAKFIEITEAYECLKDPERRRMYDNGMSGGGGRYTGDPYDFRSGCGLAAKQREGDPGQFY